MGSTAEIERCGNSDDCFVTSVAAACGFGDEELVVPVRLDRAIRMPDSIVLLITFTLVNTNPGSPMSAPDSDCRRRYPKLRETRPTFL